MFAQIWPAMLIKKLYYFIIIIIIVISHQELPQLMFLYLFPEFREHFQQMNRQTEDNIVSTTGYEKQSSK